MALALARAGEAMVQKSPPNLPELAKELLESASEKRGLLVLLSDARASSLSEDRRDYSVVSSWARPLVILRGLTVRTVLRNQIARARRELRASSERLATHGFEEQVAALRDCVPTELADEVVATGAELEHLAREREQLVAPFGGNALPRACHWVAREVVLFARFMVRELKRRSLPRAPALAGLVVGWWIAQTFTGSRAPGILRLLGFGRTGKHYVPPGTLKALSFWLPLVASAVCAYAAHRIGALIRHRYERFPESSAGMTDGKILPALSATAEKSGSSGPGPVAEIR